MRAAWNLDPEARHEERILPVGADGRLRIAVVADTHSRPHPDALALVRRERPAWILHAGDIGDLGVIDRLQAIAPTIAVRGNIDPLGGDAPPDAVTLHLDCGGERRLSLLLQHIAVRGPRLNAGARRLATRQSADPAVCGHSHVPLIARDGGLAVFNPGSIGPRRFALPITFGVLDLSPDGLGLRHVSCETGEAWRPAVSGS